MVYQYRLLPVHARCTAVALALQSWPVHRTAVLKRLLSGLQARRAPASRDDAFPTPDALWTRQQRLEERMNTLERMEVTRAGEHAAALDQLTRLYKRMTMRERREPTNGTSGESVLDLKHRLGR